jgi:hypothetical protein
MNRAPRTCHELGVCHGRKGLGCTCHHDTESLPPGGYYFAPGAIEQGPRRARRLLGWRRAVADLCCCIAIAGLIGAAAGYLQAKGWPF